MSGFLRPEVAATLSRWREPLISVGVILLGVWLILRPGPVVAGFGWVVAALGAVSLFTSIRRARFKGEGDGPGIVGLVEGRLTYMGPFYGGAVSADDISEVSFKRARDGKGYWMLNHSEGVLVIPASAKGAERLFDLFTAMPEVSAAQALAAAENQKPGTTTVWTREARVALTR